MGHVPSKEYSGKPFIADLQTAKGHVDRLIAVALTAENFTSAEDPLFKQFVSLRCDPSVLHWFNVKDPAKRTKLPTPPSAEFLYEKHITETSAAIEKGLSPDDLSPIPIALFRLIRGSKSQVLDQSVAGNSTATLRDIVAAGEEVQIVGYLGCRGGGSNHSPILSVFLDKSFWNEAKSISIFQIGCKCFEHFSALSGVNRQPQWPTELKARSLDTNLPTLRLIQKIFREYQESLRSKTALAVSVSPQEEVEPAVETGIQIEHADCRVSIAADPVTVANICRQLASSVSSEMFPGTSIHRRFRLKTQCASAPAAAPAAAANVVVGEEGASPPSPPTPFDMIVEEAKRNWNDSNALVVAAKKKEAAMAQQLVAAAAKLLAEGDTTSSTTGSAAGTTPSAPANTPPPTGKNNKKKKKSKTSTGSHSEGSSQCTSPPEGLSSKEEASVSLGLSTHSLGGSTTTTTGSGGSTTQQQQQQQAFAPPPPPPPHSGWQPHASLPNLFPGHHAAISVGGRAAPPAPNKVASAPPATTIPSGTMGMHNYHQHQQTPPPLPNHHHIIPPVVHTSGATKFSSAPHQNQSQRQQDRQPLPPPHQFAKLSTQPFVAPSAPSVQVLVTQKVAPPVAQHAHPSQPQQQQPPQPEPRCIKLPFLTPATILLPSHPTAGSNVLRPFQVKWTETDLILKPSDQRSQHQGILLEVAARPANGSLRVITTEGAQMSIPLPNPCYVNVNPGTALFLQY